VTQYLKRLPRLEKKVAKLEQAKLRLAAKSTTVSLELNQEKLEE
jgi:hypothetical protein